MAKTRKNRKQFRNIKKYVGGEPNKFFTNRSTRVKSMLNSPYSLSTNQINSTPNNTSSTNSLFSGKESENNKHTRELQERFIRNSYSKKNSYPQMVKNIIAMKNVSTENKEILLDYIIKSAPNISNMSKKDQILIKRFLTRNTRNITNPKTHKIIGNHGPILPEKSFFSTLFGQQSPLATRKSYRGGNTNITTINPLITAEMHNPKFQANMERQRLRNKSLQSANLQTTNPLAKLQIANKNIKTSKSSNSIFTIKNPFW